MKPGRMAELIETIRRFRGLRRLGLRRPALAEGCRGRVAAAGRSFAEFAVVVAVAAALVVSVGCLRGQSAVVVVPSPRTAWTAAPPAPRLGRAAQTSPVVAQPGLRRLCSPSGLGFRGLGVGRAYTGEFANSLEDICRSPEDIAKAIRSAAP